MVKNKKPTYVDGFVLIIPKKNIAKYKKISKDAGKIWMKHGALSYKECIGDNLNPSTDGHPILTFTKLTKVKKNETVWFSYIEYKSKKHRNEVNKKVMNDPAMQSDDPNHMEKMPFDVKKMAWGGFKIAVNL